MFGDCITASQSSWDSLTIILVVNARTNAPTNNINITDVLAERVFANIASMVSPMTVFFLGICSSMYMEFLAEYKVEIRAFYLWQQVMLGAFCWQAFVRVYAIDRIHSQQYVIGEINGHKFDTSMPRSRLRKNRETSHINQCVRMEPQTEDGS